MNNDFSISAGCEKDHDALDEIFQQYLNYKQTDRTRSREQLLKFKLYLERHIFCEEEILFPLYEQKVGIEQGVTCIMREEHERMRKLINLLEASKTLNDHEARALLIILGQHCVKEESVIFPALDRVLTTHEKAVVFQKIQEVSCGNIKTKQVEFEPPMCEESSFPLILPGN